MKKLTAIALLIIHCGVAHSLPVGNPSEASLLEQGAFFGTSYCDPCDPCFCWFDAWSLRMGFYGDYVFERNLQTDSSHSKRSIEKTSMHTNSGYLVLNICDRIDLFGTLGATTIKLHAHQEPFQPGPNFGTDTFDIFFDTTFSWSVGVKGTLFDWNCFALGIGGAWFQTGPDLEHIDETRAAEHLFPVGVHSRYQEWQAELGLSYTVMTSCTKLVPYAAVKCSGVQWDVHRFTTTFDGDEFSLHNFKSQKLWGYAIGISYTMCEMIAVTVEGRFADENAIYVNGQFRF